MKRGNEGSIKPFRRLLACALAPALMAACGGGDTVDAGSPSLADSTARESTADAGSAGMPPAPPGNVAAVNPDPQSIVDATLDDASTRTGRDRSTLVVVSREAVVWPDGSLGCPEPGVRYTMAPVEGYRIRIRAGADLLDYHANCRGYLVLCPTGRAVDPLPGGST